MIKEQHDDSIEIFIKEHTRIALVVSAFAVILLYNINAILFFTPRPMYSMALFFVLHLLLAFFFVTLLMAISETVKIFRSRRRK